MPNQPIAFSLPIPAALPAAINPLCASVAPVERGFFSVHFPSLKLPKKHTGAYRSAETNIAIHHLKKSLRMP
jgi:hypothetical protein